MNQLALFSRYRLYRGSGAWSPFSLFANGGVQGAYYDPSYLNTYMSGLGPELVTNGGPFTTTTGWTSLNSTLSVSSGALRVTENGISGNPYAQQSFAVTAGAWYKITFDLVALNAQKIRVWVGSAYGSANWLNSADITYTGPVTLYFLAAGSTAYFEFVGYTTPGGTSEYYEVNYVSVKEVTTIGNATMFTTSAGTTPVTAVEQNVGLILDQSQGPVLGNELVTNGDFSVGTGWSTGGVWVISGGAASITSSTTSLSQSTLAAVAGTWYRVTFTISSFTAGGVRVEFGGVNGVSRTAAGTYTQYILATSTSFLVISPIATSTLSIDNVSIKAISGNHAYVTADANRGILRSRFNQLTYSEQFDNAVWTKSNSFIQTNLLTYSEDFSNAVWSNSLGGTGVAATVTANQGTAPDGTVTADRIQFNLGGGTTTSDLTRRIQSYVTAAVPHTYSIYVRSYDGVSTYNMHIVGPTGGTTNIVVTGSWQRFEVTATGLGASAAYAIGLRGGQTPANSNTADVLAWGAQLVQGSVPGDYRATTASALPILYTDPLGGLTAQKLCESNTTSEHNLGGGNLPLGLPVGTICTVSFYAKAGERYKVGVTYPTNGDAAVAWDLSTGTQLGSILGSGVSASIQAMDDGSYRCSMTYYRPTISSTTNNIHVLANSATSIITRNYAGDGSSGVYIWGAQLVPTAVFPTNTYQRIAAATDYATGPAFPLYIQTDGTNDAMLTNTINFANGPSSPPLGPVLGSLPLNASPWVANSVTVTANSVTGTVNGNNLALPGLTIGRWYKVSASVSSVTGSWYWLAQGTGTIYRGSIGDVTFLATSAQLLLYCVSAGTVTLDSVSVAELADSAYAPDKMTVTAGVTKLSDAAGGTVVAELSADINANNGSFTLVQYSNVSGWAFGSKGTIRQNAEPTGQFLGIRTDVLTGLSQINTPSVLLRVNGTQAVVNTTSQGTSNFGNYPLYLFARGNASLYFNGYFYGAVVVQKYLSAGELASLTNWMEVRTFGKDMAYDYDYVTLDNGDLVTLDNGDPVYTNIYYS